MINFVEIENIEYINTGNIEQLNDLTVQYDHSYIANNICVHNCTTSVQTAVHHALATLIADCADIKEHDNLDTKIVADGGISTYNRAITALALGADYVMIGSAFSKCYESAAPFIFYANYENYPEYINDTMEISCNSLSKDFTYELYPDGKYIMVNENIPDGKQKYMFLTPSEVQKKEIIRKYGKELRKKYFGMSTKEAQKLINKNSEKLKTSEGVTRIINVEYTLAQWIENFKDYLKSAMSYTGKETLDDFIANVKVGILSPCEQIAFNK